jgi:RNA polymerase sigma-70 factor (ECF subfamily)
MTKANKAFSIQRRVRGPWRRYLDSLAPIRPALHRYCCKLTGNVWDGEDLVQDALIKVFSLLGKIDLKLDNPEAYLIRTATSLWIDRTRRLAREQAWLALEHLQDAGHKPESHAASLEVRDASRDLLQHLHPQERAALVLKEVFDYSLDETASILKTSTGAVKSALHRGRSRINDALPKANFMAPGREIVEQFMQALATKNLEVLEKICASDLSVELVGGAESNTFEQSRTFFSHAHTVLPAFGFGYNPRWELIEFDGEPMVVGYRTLSGIEGINEVHRLEILDDKIVRVRLYCFCPDTLQVLADSLNKTIVRRPLAYRSPSLPDLPKLLLRALIKRG